MLFHPRKKVNLLFFSIQGVFPKRQKDLAHKVGQLVSDELFSTEDVKRILKENARSEEILKVIDQHLEKIVREKIPLVAPAFSLMLNSELVNAIKKIFMSDVQDVIESMIDKLGGKLDQTLDVHQIVEEKIANFSSNKLEELMLAVMRREFKFIEVIGAFLGFMIGLVQVLLVLNEKIPIYL